MNTASDRAARIISTPGLEWLVLPGEAEVYFTNFGDGRKGDASELVATVNADSTRYFGRADWRLPTIDELNAYSTPWRTRFHADGGQCSTLMADSIPN
jgi:hypothetical protein